jgi:hypothetical protein
MRDDWTESDLREVVRALVAKAAEDPATRALVLENPYAAIEQMTGKEAPGGLRLKIVDEGPAKDLSVEIPPSVRSSSEQRAAAPGRARLG